MPGYHEECVEERKRLDDTAALLEDRCVRLFRYSGDTSPALKRLIEQCGPKIPISERVLEAVVRCQTGSPDDVMKFLFEERGDKLPITEKVVGAAAVNDRMGRSPAAALQRARGTCPGLGTCISGCRKKQ